MLPCGRRRCRYLEDGGLVWRFGCGDIVLQRNILVVCIETVTVTVTYQMRHQSTKQVEEERTPTLGHLHLHRSTTLEGAATANDESEVVCSELGVAGGSIGVGVASGVEDGAALHAGLETLLFESEALEFGEVVVVG